MIEMSHFVSSFGFEPGRDSGFLSIEIAQNMVGAAEKVGHMHCNRLDGLRKNDGILKISMIFLECHTLSRVLALK